MSGTRACACAVVAFLLISIPAGAESSSPARRAALYRQESEEAAKALAAKRFGDAAGKYARLVEREKGDGGAWAGLGRSLFGAGDVDRGASALEEAMRLGFVDRAEGGVEIARSLARAGRSRAALSRLERALADGYRFRLKIAGDPAFESLRSDPEFQRLAAGPSPPFDRVEGWRADLRFFEAEISRVHPEYRLRPLPDAFLASAADLEKDIGRLSDSQVTVRFQRLAAALGDGHSIVWPFGMQRGTLSAIPVRFHLFEDGLFIVASPSHPDLTGPHLTGRRVVTIGGLSAADALERIRPYVSRDNEMNFRWAAPLYLTLTDDLEAIGAHVDDSGVEIESEDAAGRREKTKLTAAPVDPARLETRLRPENQGSAAAKPDYLRRMDESWWIRDLAPLRAIYVLFNSVQDSGKETLADFAARLQRELVRSRARSVVVDVRNNNGGNAELLPPLWSVLAGWAAGRDHRIIVIAGRQTYSAAQTFVSTLARLAPVTFAGEPTGSRPNHLGNESPFRLPYSGLRGTLSSGLNQTAPRDSRAWIFPDLPVSLGSSDYFAGRDPALEAAIETLRSEGRARRK